MSGLFALHHFLNSICARRCGLTCLPAWMWQTITSRADDLLIHHRHHHQTQLAFNTRDVKSSGPAHISVHKSWGWQSYHEQAFKVLDYIYDLFKKLWRRWATFDVLWCSLSVWACQCQDGVVCSYSPADKALFVLGQLLLVTFSRTLHPNLREIFVRFYKLIGLSWGSRGPTWLLASELAFLSEPSRHVCSWRED